jgi:hypothetical protein
VRLSAIADPRNGGHKAGNRLPHARP